MTRVLILSDGSGWIVDRISEKFKKYIPFDIDIDYYTKITNEELTKRAEDYDLIHFNNTDVERQIRFIRSTKKPVIVSVRSFRYPILMDEVKNYVKIHVIHPDLKLRFLDARYISDGVDEMFEPKPFVVGTAFQNEEWNIEYKGVNLIKKACDEIGVIFKPCFGIPPEKMQEWYDSIDLYVCASEAEGFNTPVMECMTLNKPVLTTKVGIPKFLNVATCERTVESIKEGILMFYTYPQVYKFRWEIVANSMAELYLETINDKNRG